MFRSIVQSIFTISTRDAFLRFSFFSFPRYVSLLCILLEIFIARNQFIFHLTIARYIGKLSIWRRTAVYILPIDKIR